MGLILNRKTNHIKKSTVVFYSGTLVLLALFSTKSFAVDLLNYQLKDLKSVETHNLDQYRGNTFLMIFFQAEDGIRDVERSRGLGDVYKRQIPA